MSSETRILRPYVGIGQFQAALNSVRFWVGRTPYGSGGSTMLDIGTYARTPIDLVLAEDDDSYTALLADLTSGCEAAGLSPDDLDLVVVASSSYLKIAQVVHRVRLSKLIDEGRVVSLTDTERPLALQAPHGGCVLDAYVALAGARDPAPLRAWRKGTWLAQIRVTIRTDLGSVGFVPRPLTEETKVEFGLPSGTVRFVRLADESPLTPDVSEDAVELYVDSDLLARVSAAPNSPQSRVFQLQLFLDVVAGILESARLDTDFPRVTVAEIEGSLLQRVIAMLAGRVAGETDDALRQRQDQLLKMSRNERSRFLAHAEESCRIRQELIKAVGE